MKQWNVWCADLLLLWCATASCRDSVGESPVPAGYVTYSCTLATVNEVMEQGAPQPSIEVQGGYVRCYDLTKRMGNESWGTGGLLLVHGYDATTFYAYDLACPYCYATYGSSASKLHQLDMADDGQTAICPDCESEFGAIFWGSPAPTAGPANQNNYVLRQYRASLVGDKLVVRN